MLWGLKPDVLWEGRCPAVTLPHSWPCNSRWQQIDKYDSAFNMVDDSVNQVSSSQCRTFSKYYCPETNVDWQVDAHMDALTRSVYIYKESRQKPGPLVSRTYKFTRINLSSTAPWAMQKFMFEAKFGAFGPPNQHQTLILDVNSGTHVWRSEQSGQRERVYQMPYKEVSSISSSLFNSQLSAYH